MRPNAWVGLVAMIFGAAYGAQAFDLPQAPIGDPYAPIYFPMGLAVLMIALGAVTFIIEAKKGLNSDDKSKRPQFHFESMKLIFFVMILSFIYAFIFDSHMLGYVISTLLFLGLMLFAINRGKHLQNIVLTVVFTFGLWYVFVHIFQISLPIGPLGI